MCSCRKKHTVVTPPPVHFTAMVAHDTQERVVVAAKGHVRLTVNGESINLRAGDTSQMSKIGAQELIKNGAPIWIPR